MNIELKILDPRLSGWGFPHYGSELAAGLDLHACLDAPLALPPQGPAVLISAGIAFRIGDPEWCALVLPRSGLGHPEATSHLSAASERTTMELSEEQFQRYARHLILDEVGEEGQEKLLASRVLVVGAGGLGSPMLLYLAAAGIGTIGIIDNDRVDL